MFSLGILSFEAMLHAPVLDNPDRCTLRSGESSQGHRLGVAFAHVLSFSMLFRFRNSRSHFPASRVLCMAVVYFTPNKADFRFRRHGIILCSLGIDISHSLAFLTANRNDSRLLSMP